MAADQVVTALLGAFDAQSNERAASQEALQGWEGMPGYVPLLLQLYAAPPPRLTPDARLLNVFRHFGPVVEVGCGANAYWSRWMHAAGGVDVVALDANVAGGGRISGPSESNQMLDDTHKRGFAIRQGSPETLSRDDKLRKSGRTLFLCYPDEEDGPAANEEEGPMSMAAACLEHFSGSTIIHVGELYSDTLSLDQAPFGR